MKRTALAVTVAALIAGCASTSTAGDRHYTVVPQTQVTVREAKAKHTTYSANPDDAYVSGSGSR